MASFTDDPFAALTNVVAPAILTNASSILCLGTANRLGRLMDRRRAVKAQLGRPALTGEHRVEYERQSEVLKVRTNLVLRALRFFYMSLGSFAAAALISLFGSVLAGSPIQIGFTAIEILALLSGTVGVGGLVIGCAMMVRETRLAASTLADEAQSAADPHQ